MTRTNSMETTKFAKIALRYKLAQGHGEQQLAHLDELNMVIVVIADPLYIQHSD